ncbi:MAG: hypothetical protein ICV64_07910 [Thermoleophilia bacterium]|nr:hypothetical protein [Thermoleophilia bacterium]
MKGAGDTLAAAEEFVLREARVLDRHRFAFRFGGGSAEAAVAAVLAYRNDDGGFGHALEPDLRGAASQPVPVEHALHVLDEVGWFDDDLVAAACDWLESVSTAEGGVPFVLASVSAGPHAPWWVATGDASPNPTAGIAGLLHKHRVEHPWLARATDYCRRVLRERVAGLGADDAISVLTFVEHAPDRDASVVDALGARIRGGLVALAPDAPGYVKSPLDFAPHPAVLARTLFDDATIEAHLDALAAKQQEDGGWPITWDPPSAAAVNEWRGFMTVSALTVPEAYGRLR